MPHHGTFALEIGDQLLRTCVETETILKNTLTPVTESLVYHVFTSSGHDAADKHGLDGTMSSLREKDAALLKALFAAEGQWVTLRKLAKAADITESAIERHLAPYVEAGYPLEFHPLGGVILHEPPDIWSAEEILGRCPPPARKHPAVPKWDPVLLAETASTNNVARLQGRKGARAGLVVAASRQTSGRGA